MTDHSSSNSVIEGPRDDEAPAGSYTAPTDPRDYAVVPEEVNASSKWAMYSVFSVATPLPADDVERRQLIEGSDEWVGQSGVETRGWYDLSGLRARIRSGTPSRSGVVECGRSPSGRVQQISPALLLRRSRPAALGCLLSLHPFQGVVPASGC